MEFISLYSEKTAVTKFLQSISDLKEERFEALNSMAENFEKETGKRDLLISSGVRSYDEQLEIYSSAVESKGIDYAKNMFRSLDTVSTIQGCRLI